MFYCVLPGTYAVSILWVIHQMLWSALQVVTPSIMTAFGPDFFAPNLGLLYTATLFYFGIIMIVSQVILNNIGLFDILLNPSPPDSGLVCCHGLLRDVRDGRCVRAPRHSRHVLHAAGHQVRYSISLTFSSLSFPLPVMSGRTSGLWRNRGRRFCCRTKVPHCHPDPRRQWSDQWREQICISLMIK